MEIELDVCSDRVIEVVARCEVERSKESLAALLDLLSPGRDDTYINAAVLIERAIALSKPDMVFDIGHRYWNDLLRRVRKHVHDMTIKPVLDMLADDAARAYYERRVSDGYWARQSRELLRENVGYRSVRIVGSMVRSRSAHPGVIFVRPATGTSRWPRPRIDRYGPALTIRAMLETAKIMT